MKIKFYRHLKWIFNPVPIDNGLVDIARIFEIDTLKVQIKNTTRVVVEGVQDPIFFGLFASILSDLRKIQPINAQILQTRSINGAIGVGFRAKLLRSSIITYIANKKWEKISLGIIGFVGCRSISIFQDFLNTEDKIKAADLWKTMKSLNRPEFLYLDGIQIGDLVIDSYLRYRPSPSFRVEDAFVLKILIQVVRDVRRNSNFFLRFKPCLYLSTYSTYVEHGIPIRLALSLGITVRVYGNAICAGKKLSSDNFFHTADFNQYRAKFNLMSPEAKKVALSVAEDRLKYRLSGGIDFATSYMVKSAYGDSRVCIPDVRGAVIVFLHDFYDSPHIYNHLVFNDFWDWACYTIQTLSDAKIPFFVKPHPNQISLSQKVLDDLRMLFPNIKFLSEDISNLDLINSGMICGVTVYGTVAHELAYFGISTIACAEHPHVNFDFCRTASTKEQYKAMLETPHIKPLAEDEMRNQALAFYYMHNMYGSKESIDLREKFHKFWRLCDSSVTKPSLIVESLLELKKSCGWQMHINELEKDIKGYEG